MLLMTNNGYRIEIVRDSPFPYRWRWNTKAIPMGMKMSGGYACTRKSAIRKGQRWFEQERRRMRSIEEVHID